MLTGVAGSMAYMAPEILAKRGYTYTIDWWSLGVCAYELLFGRRPFRGKTNTELTQSISKDILRFPENVEQKCSQSGLNALKGVSYYLVRQDDVGAWLWYYSVPYFAGCSSNPSLVHAFLIRWSSHCLNWILYGHRQLLGREPSKRLGCSQRGKGFSDIKGHPWFQEIDWNTLESKEKTPPFVPDVRKSHGNLATRLTILDQSQANKANFDASHELEELLLEDNPLKAKTRKANQDKLSREMKQMEEQLRIRRCSLLTGLTWILTDSCRTTSSRCNAGPTILRIDKLPRLVPQAPPIAWIRPGQLLQQPMIHELIV